MLHLIKENAPSWLGHGVEFSTLIILKVKKYNFKKNCANLK